MKRFFFLLILSLASLTFSSTLLGVSQRSTSKDSISPPPSVGAIIEVFNNTGESQGIILIQRGKTPIGKAIPGGRMEPGESIKQAVRREMKEEVGLPIYELRQFHVYSSPIRDSKWYTTEIIYLAKAYEMPIAGDDAAEAFVMNPSKIPWDELVFDHAQILKDYLSYREGNNDITIIIP